MTKLKKVRYKTKNRTGAFVLFLRLLIALFATTVLLALPAHVLAQQSTQSGAPIQVMSEAIATEDNTIRPFRVHIPQELIDDLHRRLVMTRWPDQETVTDRSQGVQLTTIQELVGYWQTDYDWRKAETKLNALPQFMTTIDGADLLGK